MDLTKLKIIQDFESDIYADWQISDELKKGWVIVTTRTIRSVNANGSFTDKTIYTLGHESENP